MSSPTMRIEIAGAEALIVYFDSPCRQSNAAAVAQFDHALKRAQPAWLIETTPSYASLLICYDIFSADLKSVYKQLGEIKNNSEKLQRSTSKLVELPVCYELGCDLEAVAKATQLSTEDVINRHQAVEYRVYAIGFAPGFAYLGDLDPALALPRLATPRRQVAAGSLAIAERQTAVYPAPSPGGWHIIGRCPLRLFDPSQTPAMPFAIGDRVRFYNIDKHDFAQLGGTLA